MPTFGNTNNESFVQNIEGSIYGGRFTISENGIATSMSAYLTVTTASKKTRLMIYRVSDNVLIGVTEERVIATGTDVLETFNFNYSVNLASGVQYALCAWMEAGGGFGRISSDGGGGAGSDYSQTIAYSSYPPEPAVPAADNGTLISIYCTYTAGQATIFGNNVRQSAPAIITVEDQIIAARFTSPAFAVTCDSITPFLNLSVSGTDTKVTCGIYRQSDRVKIAETVEITFPVASVGALKLWRRFTFASPPTLAASTDYLLAIFANATAGSVTINSKNAAGSGYYVDAQTYPTFADPIDNASDADDLVEVFADYTVVSSGLLIPSGLTGGMKELRGGMRG